MSFRSRRRVRVALPWLRRAFLEVAEGSAPRERPELRWLVEHAVVRRAEPGTWREWLLQDSPQAARALRQHAAGPCLHALGGHDGAVAHWACAEPVQLVPAIDHLRLAWPGRVDLDAGEAQEIATSLNDHLAGTGFAVIDQRGPGWLLRCPDGLEADCADPAEAAGRDLRDFLPRGRDATRLQSVLNEVQMLLHDHPVNVRRHAASRPPVNSLWIWGIGPSAPAEGAALEPLAADDPWLCGLWRVLGQQGVAPAGVRGLLESDQPRVLVALTRTAATPESALDEVESGLLAELRRSLAQGVRHEVTLLAGDIELSVRRGRRWKIWNRPASPAEVFG